MYTILYTPKCMDFASKLAEKLGDSIIISIDDVLKDPSKLGDYDRLGLIFNTEGKIVPADIEDLILDDFAKHPSHKTVEYLFSICLTDGRSNFGLKVVEKLCQKIGYPSCLNLSFPFRTRNSIDIDRAAYHIKSQHYISACSNFATSLYMTRYGVLTGKLREGKKNIIEPHISVFEESRRLARWIIGIPIMTLAFIFPVIALSFIRGLSKFGMYLNVIGYSFMAVASHLVIKYLLKFPIWRMVTQNRHFCWRNMITGSVSMAIFYISTNLIWMAISPHSFSLTVGDVTWRTILPTFITVILQTLIDVLICISYVAFFRNDTMPTSKQEQIICCLASSALFIFLHGRSSIYSMIASLISGFALAAITFRTNGTEAALGIRFSYKLITALLFTYNGASLTSKAVFTQSDKVGPMLVIQYAFCMVASIGVVLLFRKRKKQRKQAA